MTIRRRLDRLRCCLEHRPVAIFVEQKSDEELLRLVGLPEATDEQLDAMIAAGNGGVARIARPSIR